MKVSDITSADWALSTAQIAEVVEGIADINQCIAIILTTKKGSDPFRPTFGSDIWEWIDRPLPVAMPNMKRAIHEAVGTWEPRVIITNIEHEYQDASGASEGVLAGIKFNITWRLRNSARTGTAEVNLGLYNQLVKAAQTQIPPAYTSAQLTDEAGNPIITEAGQNIIV